MSIESEEREEARGYLNGYIDNIRDRIEREERVLRILMKAHDEFDMGEINNVQELLDRLVVLESEELNG